MPARTQRKAVETRHATATVGDACTMRVMLLHVHPKVKAGGAGSACGAQLTALLFARTLMCLVISVTRLSLQAKHASLAWEKGLRARWPWTPQTSTTSSMLQIAVTVFPCTLSLTRAHAPDSRYRLVCWPSPMGADWSNLAESLLPQLHLCQLPAMHVPFRGLRPRVLLLLPIDMRTCPALLHLCRPSGCTRIGWTAARPS